MKNWHYNFGIFIFAAFLGSLFAFAKKRNNARQVKNTGVEFLDNTPLFITEDLVNKMLKETPTNVGNLSKENIDLSKLEQRIEKQKHIQNAEVYLSVNGQLEAKIKQRTPVARIFSSIPFYLDKAGFKIPLSTNYTMRVPLVYNYTDGHKATLLKLLEQVGNDQFLKELIVGIYCLPNNDFSLKIRNQQFLVQTGGVNDLQLKFENFKAFYAKVKKDQLYSKYKHVNLEITNQVICTKV